MWIIIAYILLIVASDWVAARWIIPLPFGIAAPAAVFLVAPIFTLRDRIHDDYGARTVYALIGIASGLSYAISVLTGNAALGRVTIASVIAFIASETADTAIYQTLLQTPFVVKAFASNLVSTAIDSIIFITIGFGFIPSLIVGQYVVKMTVSTLTIVALWRTKHKND